MHGLHTVTGSGLAALVATAALLAPPSSVAEPVTATLHWAERATLGLTVSGTVAAISVRPGERVQRGDELLHLDARIFKFRVDEAAAEVSAIEPELAEAKREHERAQDLYERTLLADHELQLARNAELRLVAAVRKARAALGRRRVELEQSVLRAPFDGIVLAVPASAGQAIANRLQITPLVELGSSTSLRARALVTAERAAGLESGAEASVEVAGQRHRGVIQFIAPEPIAGRDAQALLYAVDVLIQPAESVPLRVGGTVTVDLP